MKNAIKKVGMKKVETEEVEYAMQQIGFYYLNDQMGHRDNQVQQEWLVDMILTDELELGYYMEDQTYVKFFKLPREKKVLLAKEAFPQITYSYN